MIIAADIGNTNIVIGVFDAADEPEFVLRLPSDTRYTAAQWQAALSERLGGYFTSSQINGIILSSVVPALTESVGAALKNLSGLPVLTVDASFDSGLDTGNYDRASLGNDRVVDLVAAMAQFAPPVAVFDLGTATTVSVADDKGRFCGGLIMPGMKLSADALSSRAAQLPEICLEPTGSLLGLDTVSCMQNGIIFGTAAQIDGLSQRIDELFSRRVTTVITGGLARLVIPHCKRKLHYDEHLLLKGLRILFDRHAKP